MIAALTPKQQQKIISAVQQCKRDFLYLAGKFLKIQARTGGQEIHLKLNGPQLILHDIIENHIKPKRPVRIVALKARRMGFSTYVAARFYHKVCFHKNRYAAQVTHEPEATDTLFKMIKRFYDKSPFYLKPETRYNNTKLLEFNTKDGSGMGSAIRVGTAEKENMGSGQAYHFLHLSESAKWNPEKAADLLVSLLQTVPDDQWTEIIFESTAYGVGGEFYTRFWGAKYRIWVKKLGDDGAPVIEEDINESAEADNQYTSVFLPWFCFEEYRQKAPEGFRLTATEQKIKEEYGLDMDQMYWRRLTVANKCDGKEEIFDQEYPVSPLVAFLASGRPVFDNIRINQLKESAPKPACRYEYEFLVGGGGHFVKSDTGRLRVWEEPKSGEVYLIGADVAEGLAHGDYSVAYVINRRTGEQVACWHGKCDPDQFARILYQLGQRYNWALLAPERNNHGLLVVHMLQGELKYPDRFIYGEMIPEPPGKPRKRFGWQTNTQTRPLIIDNLVREAREGYHGIKDAELFDEMLSFKVQSNGKQEADPGRHDDRIMAAAIAKYVRHSTPMPAQRQKNDGKARYGMRPRKRLPAEAW